MRTQKIFLFFLIFAPFVTSTNENSLVESSLDRFLDISNYLSEFLEDFNDRYIGQSEWGTVLGYDNIKPRIRDVSTSRGIKKMSMAMMPLIFHIGATSTWMILTSIMAVKSVAIGLILLVFKIAVSSAKVASWFTILKSKHSDHHHEYAWSSHGSERSQSLNEIPIHNWNSHNPELSPSEPYSGYKTIPTLKENHISSYEVHEEDYEESNKHATKKNG